MYLHSKNVKYESALNNEELIVLFCSEVLMTDRGIKCIEGELADLRARNMAARQKLAQLLSGEVG
mgnify:CR=1 FL=1